MKKANTHPLRIVRCQNNLTTVKLAEEARVGASTIWRAEHNYAINAESRRRLCEYFGKTSQELGLLSTVEQQTLIDEDVSIEHLVPLLANRPQGELHLLQSINSAKKEISSDLSAPLHDQNGPWLLFEAQQLASLFEASWTLDAVLESLRIILQGMQAIPIGIRKTLLQAETHFDTKHISKEERAQLTAALDQSIKKSWQIFHTSSPRQVIVLGQTLLRLVQQTRQFLAPDIYPSFFSTICNLIGSGLYFQNDYAAAQQAHTKAFRVALEGHDLWNQAQSLNWQAIVSNASGHHQEAIHHLETALRFVEGQNDREYLRLRAHLLANWAYNASIIGDQFIMERKLEASAAFLEHLDPNEEFDLIRWHQMAGDCMLMNHQYTQAIHHLEQALAQLPAEWLERRILTLIPLAKAYAHKQERDASIAIAREAATAINAVASVMLQQRFTEYLRILNETFPSDKQVQDFIIDTQ